jgi:hypothetical protein
MLVALHLAPIPNLKCWRDEVRQTALLLLARHLADTL